MRIPTKIKKLTIIIMIISLVVGYVMPVAASAREKKAADNKNSVAGSGKSSSESSLKENGKKTVRVGWHEPPYFIKDEYGRWSGYSYEYQRKVAAYTGWEYEYVEGSFSKLLQMLKDGEIDMLSNVSYSEERAEYMLYSSIPMGTEAYCVFVSPESKDLISGNIESLNGKRIGVTKGSIQKDYFLEWAQTHDISAEIVELDTKEEESIKLLGKDIDAFVTVDVYGSHEFAIPVCKIGYSDYFFVVNKNRPDILTDLEVALNRIQDENKYYDQQLNDRYLKNSESNRYLNASEKEWLSDHKETIVVGYQDNYLAFCAQDKSNGELTGALKDYLEYAAVAFENSRITFKTVCYPTAAAAIEAMKNGEIDCMFPSNLTSYDAEQMDLIITPSIMRTEMDAVVRASEKKEFLRKKEVVVAVNKGNTNYDMFLADHYPEWKRKYYDDTPTGLEAVADGDADCVIISNYRYNNISKQCEKLHLTTVYTGVDMDYCFAVCKGNNELYSILARMTDVVPDATIHTSLTFYSTEDVKTGFVDIIKENLFIVMGSIALVMFIIIILLLRTIRAERRIMEDEHLVRDLNKRVFVDALTSVRNKGGYNEYVKKLQNHLDLGEQFEFAIGVFDCNYLKKINDQYGHDKGDIYLRKACHLICKVYEHSPVFRVGGDEFVVILMNNDLINREELEKLFEKRRKEICEAAENKWEEVNIAYGFALHKPQDKTTVSEVAKQADKLMYENKKLQKEHK